MVYHVSPTHGITTLIPRVSTHGKAYVYAIENLTTALVFGVEKDDFDFMLSTDEAGRPSLYECYPHAFQKKYQGQSCSVYELKEEGFLRGMTSWRPELVSEQEVPVEREILVPDLYEKLLEEEKNGNLAVYRYRNEQEYRKLISEHIVDRIIRFGILEKDWEKDIRFQVYFRPLAEALLAAMDGHLLQETVAELP